MKILSLIVLAAMCTSGLHAQQQPRATKTVLPPVPSSTFSASGFADYFYHVQHPVEAEKGANAFELRRINIGFEHLFSRTVNVFTQVEANSDGSAAEYSLFMKQAYVEVKNILPQMRVVMGLSPTPAVVTSERIWGYRSLQALPLELYGMAPSVDNGVAMKGKIDPDGIISYHVMVGNGTGTLRETDNIKRLYASVGLTPMTGFMIEGYADFENAGNERYRSSFKGLIGLEESDYAFGLEGIYRINHHTVSQWYDQSPYAISIYGWGQAADEIRIVYRGDYYDDDQNNSRNGMRTVQATLGIDYLPVSDVHVIPNVMYTSYANKNSNAPKLDNALTVRLTAAFSFSSLK
jgi:hypothetical protein